MWYLYLSEPPRSQLETACLETPIFSANSSCENPFCFRRAIMLSASLMLILVPPSTLVSLYLVLRLLSTKCACQTSNLLLREIAIPQIIFASIPCPVRVGAAHRPRGIPARRSPNPIRDHAPISCMPAAPIPQHKSV